MPHFDKMKFPKQVSETITAADKLFMELGVWAFAELPIAMLQQIDM